MDTPTAGFHDQKLSDHTILDDINRAASSLGQLGSFPSGRAVSDLLKVFKL